MYSFSKKIIFTVLTVFIFTTFTESGKLNNEACDANDQCSNEKGLECRNNKCACPDFAVYEKGKLISMGDLCALKAGSKCVPGDNNKPCVNNAECTSGMCKCKEGYNAIEQGNCFSGSGKLIIAIWPLILVVSSLLGSYYIIS